MKMFKFFVRYAAIMAFAAVSPSFGQGPWNIGTTGNEAAVSAALNGGTLTISGSGAMRNFSNTNPPGSGSNVPWNDLRNSITSVVIENGVTNIGNNMFIDHTALTSFTIGNSVGGNPNINGVFLRSNNLASISVAADNPIFSSEDGVWFNKSKTSIILYPVAKQGAFIIPNGVTAIARDAFNGRTGLTSITIPGSVDTIGIDAFMDCSALASVSIGEGVTTIRQTAFRNTSALTSLIIPNSVTTMGSNVFQGSGLTSISIGSGVNDLSHWTFAGTAELASIEVAAENAKFSSLDGVLFDKTQSTLIKYPQKKQGAYTIPNSVSEIQVTAFHNAAGLTSLVIGDGIIEFDDHGDLFQGAGMIFVSIGKNVAHIGEVTFSGSEKLITIDVVEDNANYSSLDGVMFNKNQTAIVKYPVGRQGGYIIPDGVSKIENFAFANANGLTSITAFQLVPPEVFQYSFAWITDLSKINLYVLQSAVAAYSAHEIWGKFNVLAISSVDASAITGVVNPVAGATASTNIDDGEGFTSSLVWNGNPATFAHNTIYTAEISLTAKEGFAFLGLNAENISGFTINGIAPVFVSNNGTTLVFTIEFPETGAPTSISNPVKSENRYGIRFAENIVSERAEISVVLPNGEASTGSATANVAIYDMTGNVVWTSTASAASTGSATGLSWDLRNQAGRFVANGTYLVIAEAKDRNGKVHRYSARLGVKR